jgi:hypothetical protein
MTPIQILLYLAALYNLALTIIIIWKSHAGRAGGSFAWYVFSTAAWAGLVATMQFPNSQATAKLLAQSTFECGTFIGISWIWFCANFPFRSLRFSKIATVIILLGLPWLVLSWTDLIIKRAFYVSWGLETEPGSLDGLWALWVYVGAIAGMVHMAYKVKLTRGLERLQVRYILLGSIGLLVIGTWPNVILPWMTHSSRYAMYGPLASLFVTTTTTYAIVR